MSECPVVPLGDVVEILDSRRIPLSSVERGARGGPYPYYGATSVIDHVDDYLFDGLHLLVGEDGSVETPSGRPVTQLVSGRFWVNNHAHVLRGRTDADTRYLGYALTSIPVRPFVTGSVQAKLSQANLRRIPVPYPGADARARIAGILGALDDKIALNHEMARSLIEGIMVLYNGLAANHDDSAPARPIYEVANVVYGATFSSASFSDPGVGVPLLRIRDLKTESPGVWTTELHPKGQRVAPGDVLVGMDGEFRAYVWAGDSAWLNQRVCSFIAKAGVSPAFVFAAIQAPLAEVETTEAGTTVIHLGKADIDRFRVPAPGPAALARFDGAAQPMLERAVWARRQATQLQRLRDELLPRLLAGALVVKRPSRGNS